ncbi:MAG TPA: PAS domain S-box protein [Gemmatimonadaceae bacterium]|nr:PAS domain S-box protein [Gemmatimonadaceae bacterium]
MKPFDLLRPNRGASPPPPAPVAAPAGELGGFSPDALLALGSDGCVMQANAAAIDLFGKPFEKLTGQRLDQLLDDPPASTGSNGKWEPRPANGNGAARTAGVTGRADRYDARVTRARGDERIVSIVTGPLRLGDEEGAPSGTIVSIRDVSEERRSLEELARSEARYRHLFEGANDAIMTFDSMGRFTTVNDAGEVLSGYAREELIGRFFGPLLAMEALPRAIIEFRRALSGNVGHFETVIVRKDGERRYMTVNYACPQRSREVLCVIRDATEEKRLQQQLIQSEKMAAIGQLVSGVAHEVNNPLASISAFAQLMMADRTLKPDQRHSMEVISGEARRAARIVHNLLTFARQHKAEKTLADINKVLDDSIELRAYELNVRGIRIEREFDSPPPETMADIYQLQQVVLNLITNAEQAMAAVDRPHHRLTLRCRTQGDTIRIEVEDTGPGIPPESLDVIFNPFFTTKPTGQGTGLGLSISLGIVSEHGGRIWAERANPGARFCIELPLVQTGKRATTAGAPAVAQNAPSLRVLVVDDEEPIRMALERFLASAGHEVVTVASGSEAIWRGEGDEVFDAILLDMRMPDVSGQQIFQRWSADRPDLAERVVFLTGDIVSADLQQFLTSTGRPFLPKPFEFDAVVRALPARRP